MFNVNDRIRIKAYDDFPAARKSNRMGLICGNAGVITRKLIDSSTNEAMYEIKLDSYTSVSKRLFTADELEKEVGLPRITLSLQIDEVKKLVVAEARGEDGEIIASAFGKILGNDAQAILTGAKYATQFLESKIKITNRTWEERYHV